MSIQLDPLDTQLLQLIQGDLPITLDPYGALAEELGCTRELVLTRLGRLMEDGVIRRIGAILYHQHSGYTSNGMFVCRVTDQQINEAGTLLASFDRVSHCYERQAAEDWPYNLYAMIHGKSRSEVLAVVEQFTQVCPVQDYEMLFSLEELKKTSFQF